MTIKILGKSELPSDFVYPDSYLKTVRLNLIELEPWYFMDKQDVIQRIQGMRIRYPNRILIPFARRGDNDDVACFETNFGEKVQIIHDFASVGYEQRKTFDSFWDWFREAIDDMIQFD